MSACPTCGSSMVHFENPSREECPNTSDHARIAADRRQQAPGKGDKNVANRTGGRAIKGRKGFVAQPPSEKKKNK